MTPRIAFTIGYQGASADELVDVLRDSGVDTVIDTRRNPQSRKAAFRRRALEARLTSEGISYQSMPSLGVPREFRDLAKTDWDAFVATYEAILADDQEALGQAVAVAFGSATALLCFESDERQCHRLPLALAMSARAPLAFDHLHVRRMENADDHPVLPAVVSSEDQVNVAAG